MKIRKYILAVFIVFSLSFSFQPVIIYSKETDAVVFILEHKQDKLTNEFLNKNDTKRFIILISLTLQFMLYNERNKFFNTS